MEMKATNGIATLVTGAEQDESVFLEGGVKKEPQDLTRKCNSPQSADGNERVIVATPPNLLPEEEHKQSGISQDKMSYMGPYHSPQPSYETVSYIAASPQSFGTSPSPVVRASPALYPASDISYYRDYYSTEPQYTTLRQEYPTEPSFERYQSRTIPSSYKPILTAESSPDSGISTDTSAAREHSISMQQVSHDYSCHHTKNSLFCLPCQQRKSFAKKRKQRNIFQRNIFEYKFSVIQRFRD